MNPLHERARQGLAEHLAGYLHGLNGGSRPGREKGNAYFGGYLCGKAEREDRQASTQDIGR